MAIIIDTNTFADVFVRSSKDHKQFAPVLDWIINGKGLAVYGGKKYISELRKAHKFIKIFRFLKESGKIIEGNSTIIDKLEQEVIDKVKDKKFDDPHLAAIVIATKCMLICTKDTRSVIFVKRPDLYPKGIKIPAYYISSKNSNLLCDKYIHKDHKPLTQLAPKTANKIINRL